MVPLRRPLIQRELRIGATFCQVIRRRLSLRGRIESNSKYQEWAGTNPIFKIRPTKLKIVCGEFW